MDKVITIGEQEIGLRANALTPRMYRFRTKRDLICDLTKLRKATKKAASLPADATEDEIEETNASTLSMMDLTIFEDIAFVMAKHYDPTLPENSNDWLDTIDGVFSIYTVLPIILEMWQLNEQTTAIPVKKQQAAPVAKRVLFLCCDAQNQDCAPKIQKI